MRSLSDHHLDAYISEIVAGRQPGQLRKLAIREGPEQEGTALCP